MAATTTATKGRRGRKRQNPLLGWTPLHYAAANGQDRVYKELLSAGANPGLRDGQGRTAERLLRENLKVGHVHLRYLNPLPIDLGGILKKYKHILIPEVNMGQLRSIIRDKYVTDAQGLNLVRGRPIRASMIVTRAKKILGV